MRNSKNAVDSSDSSDVFHCFSFSIISSFAFPTKDIHWKYESIQDVWARTCNIAYLLETGSKCSRTALCVLLSVHCISPKDLISGRHKLTLGRIVPPRTKDQALACIKKVNKIIHRQWHFSVSIIKCKVVPCLWTSDLTLSLFTAAFCLSGHVYLSWLSCWPITFPHLAMQRNQLLTTNLATIHGLVHLSICKER